MSKIVCYLGVENCCTTKIQGGGSETLRAITYVLELRGADINKLMYSGIVRKSGGASRKRGKESTLNLIMRK